MCDPECAHLLGVLVHDTLGEIGDIDAVGGLELGAVPLTGIAIAKAPSGKVPFADSLSVRNPKG